MPCGGRAVQVNYAGLDSHPGADINRRQASSAGSLLSFTTNECGLRDRMIRVVHCGAVGSRPSKCFAC